MSYENEECKVNSSAGEIWYFPTGDGDFYFMCVSGNWWLNLATGAPAEINNIQDGQMMYKNFNYAISEIGRSARMEGEATERNTLEKMKCTGDIMNTNHIAQNIGNALYLGRPHKITVMKTR